MSILDSMSPLEILTLTLIGEARGEPIEGIVAVANVINNRLRSKPSRYHTYTDVCLERRQFSCWNEGDPNRAMLLDIAARIANNQPIDDVYMRQCAYIAAGIASGSILDNTNHALNYMTSKLFTHDRPKWADYPKAAPITHGNQVFFNV